MQSLAKLSMRAQRHFRVLSRHRTAHATQYTATQNEDERVSATQRAAAWVRYARPMPGQIRVERDGPVASVVFDHPERRNAVTTDMWLSIPGIAKDLDADPGVRVVVLRGEGDLAFVSGADISQFAESRTGDRADQYDMDNLKAFDAISSIGKPVIAAIAGPAASPPVKMPNDTASGNRLAVRALKMGVDFMVRPAPWICARRRLPKDYSAVRVRRGARPYCR